MLLFLYCTHLCIGTACTKLFIYVNLKLSVQFDSRELSLKYLVSSWYRSMVRSHSVYTPLSFVISGHRRRHQPRSYFPVTTISGSPHQTQPNPRDFKIRNVVMHHVSLHLRRARASHALVSGHRSFTATPQL